MAHTLLLADDSVTIQRVIELTFADEDIRVVSVGDGQQAIDRITADPPDIVLADTGMPERDGYEVATFIKADPALAHIPVVLLTGAFEPVDDDRAKQAGCDAVLVKPFEPQVVIKRVCELLGQAAAPAAREREAESSLPAGFEARRRPPVVAFDRDDTPEFPRPVVDTPAEPDPPPPEAPADDDPVTAYLDRVDAALDLLDNDDTPTDQPQEIVVAEPPQDTLEIDSLEGALSALEGALDNLSLEPAPVADDTSAEVVDESGALAPAAPETLAPEEEPIPEPVVEHAAAPVVNVAADPVPEAVVDPAPAPVVDLVPDPVPEPVGDPALAPVVDSVPDPSLRELELAFASEPVPTAEEQPVHGFDPVPPAPLGATDSVPPIERDVTVDEQVDQAVEGTLEQMPVVPTLAPAVEPTTTRRSDLGPELTEQTEQPEEPAGGAQPSEPDVLIQSTPVVDPIPLSAGADEPPRPTAPRRDAVVEPPVTPALAERSDDAWSPPSPVSPPPPSASVSPPAAPPSLADAFASLLAAERGETTRGRTPYPWPTSSAPASLDGDLVDRVTERVLARLSETVSTELVSQIVTRVAERLVRAELDRQK